MQFPGEPAVLLSIGIVDQKLALLTRGPVGGTHAARYVGGAACIPGVPAQLLVEFNANKMI